MKKKKTNICILSGLSNQLTEKQKDRDEFVFDYIYIYIYTHFKE